MNNRALSLIELMISLALLAIVSAIIIPRFLDVRKNSLIQVAHDHAKTVETALSAWVASQASVSAAVSNFGSALDMADGYFMDTGGTCPSCTKVEDFLDPSFLDNSNLSAINTGTEIAYYTDQMAEIKGTIFSNINIDTTTVTPVSSLGHAHMRVVWPPFGGSDQSKLRLSTNPTVVLFVPED